MDKLRNYERTLSWWFPLPVLRKQFCAHGIFSRGARCSFMSSHQSKCINSSCVIKLFCILLMHNWVKSPQHYDLAICFCRKWFKIVLGKCVTLFTETRFFSFPLFFAFFKKKKSLNKMITSKYQFKCQSATSVSDQSWGAPPCK